MARCKDVSIIFVGTFSTQIQKYKDGDYYQLSLNTTPNSNLINTNKSFKTIKNARKYYFKQLEKILKDTQKELNLIISLYD